MKQYSLPSKLAKQAMNEADNELRKKHAKGVFDIGDPNNPIYNNGYNYACTTLFGYEQNAFLAKQY